MMNGLWALFMLIAISFSMSVGTGGDPVGTLLQAAMDAVSLCIRLAGGFAFWNGLMAILEDSGAVRALTRVLCGSLSRLFPNVRMEGETGQAITMNLAANMLGLGNAATPMGIKAMRLLGQDAKNGIATEAMCMFLVINASSIQLIPSSVIALRAAAGSAAPSSILLTTLVSTAVSTAVGIGVCLLFSRRRRHA